MIRPLVQDRDSIGSAPRPMACLLGEDADEISLTMIYRRIMDGFAKKDVEAFLASCVRESTKETMMNRLGMSSRSRRHHQRTEGGVRLSAHQSAQAFRYAQMLERSILVFGTQASAEEWLGRPCRSLDGNVPLIMVENSIGAQVVGEYLRRIESGVYQ